MKRTLFYGVVLIMLTGSCRTPNNLVYFQGIENLTPDQLEAMNQRYTPRICIDDALIINVSSPDRTTAAPFATPPYGFYAPGEAAIGISATTQNLFTYLVDENGYINFPVLGRIHVAGLTINETVRMLEERIWETAPTAVVAVQIANFKASIIGEVKLPDTYYIKSTRFSILDLISMGGDLTPLADRKNVWIHRDNNGEKIHVRMDLTDPAIFASPYYYLQQNDIVYVHPNEAQKRNSQFSMKDDVRLTAYSAIITTLSLVITAMLTLRGQNR